jgi:glycyl-tRNA synthetase beta chain
MSDLLLELFSEEIPAIMQKDAEAAYNRIFSEILIDNAISFNTVKVFIGSRRLVIYISGLPQVILSSSVEIKGPRVDAAYSAIEGFCRSHNISKANLTTSMFKDSLCYVYIKPSEQIDVKSILLNIIPKAIKQYVWPKSMYWGDYGIKWIRPLRNILCLFNGEVLAIQFGHLVANNITFGHRFMSNGEIKVKNFDDYKEKLKQNYVVLDRLERRELIKQGLLQAIKEIDEGLVYYNDENLLEEVTGLVEFPKVMVGKIDSKFLELPSEALVASMRTHQKYFSLFYEDGSFAPYFLFVSNMCSKEDIIVKGNEKVISARLSDAAYFYENDLKKGLVNMSEGLKNLLFHEKLGTMYDKVERVSGNDIEPGEQNSVAQNLSIAAKLYKNDLVSEMVGEFPELQGIMGYYYVANAGFLYNINDDIAIAIKEHYKPQGINDSLPQIREGAILAMQDKCDSLVGLMMAGERATSSSDSYGLRRLAIAVVRLSIEYKFDLKFYIATSVNSYIKQANINNLLLDFNKNFSGINNPNKDFAFHFMKLIMPFIEERTKYYFKNQGFDINLINTIIDFDQYTNLSIILDKLNCLKDFLLTELGKNLISLYKRVSSIIRDEQFEGNINIDNFTSEYEQQLLQSCQEISEQISCASFYDSLCKLSNMHSVITRFFDNVMVKVANQEVANNRLLLLQNVKMLFNKVANFEALL